MTMNPIAKAIGLSACLLFAAGLAGCRIHVEKDATGDKKNVQVDTPFGGIHVNTDQTTAADIGLPVYPGAQVARDHEDDKSADVHLGFGDWELRVKVVNYTAPDAQDKVVAFYKNALGRYGAVLTCQDNVPVGTPTQTADGLTCVDDWRNHNVTVDTGGFKTGRGGFQLRAGSVRHQHIVGFESSGDGQTRFALVALDLPSADSGSSDKKSN